MTDPSEPTDPIARIASVLETRIAPALERIATALERSALPAPSFEESGEETGVHESPGLGVIFPDAFEAEDESPGGPEADDPGAIGDKRACLDAAKAANDPDAVLSYRGELARLLDPDALGVLDREVLSWIMGLLMKRMRTGTVRADVAGLAAKVAEAFPHRPEGASLRASLPTLRRSAGLCARCAGPYSGVEDACPRCLPGTSATAESPPGPASAT